jgi:hypothetical protein
MTARARSTAASYRWIGGVLLRVEADPVALRALGRRVVKDDRLVGEGADEPAELVLGEVPDQPVQGHRGRVDGRSAELLGGEALAFPAQGGALEVQEPDEGLLLAGLRRWVRSAVEVHPRNLPPGTDNSPVQIPATIRRILRYGVGWRP